MPAFLDRRSFLTSSAAMALAGALPLGSITRAYGALRPKTDDPFLGWPIGAQSYSLRNFDLVEAARHLQGLGLHHVELYSKHLPLDAAGEQLAEILGVLKQAEIKLVAHGVASFNADHEANRAVFEFAKRAQVGILTANPEPNSFESLDKLVEEYGVRIAIHNHGPGALYDKIEDVVKAVEGHHPSIGACVDTGHFIRSKEDPVEAVRRLGARVFALHLKDEEKQEPESQNVVVGQGFLDLVGMFKTLKEINFPADGALSLEYEANPDNPVDDMQQCVVAIKAALAEVGPFS